LAGGTLVDPVVHVIDEPVRIVPYDPAWAERVEEERPALAAAIAAESSRLSPRAKLKRARST
jgi:GrpB-like predicted nucleotidyltransferase (UPF0157 family)